MFNGTTTTYFVGNHYEVTGSTIIKYYYAGAQRIATLAPHCVWCSAGVRTNGTLNFLLGDHLGSTSLTTNSSGQIVSELRYKAWGETRYASGTTPTKYQYPDQYSYTSDFGLYFYNARWYDPGLGRFAQADNIIPGIGPQAWDRYAYALNSPVRYIDPSGHLSEDEIMNHFGVSKWKDVLGLFDKGGKFEGMWGWLEVLRQARFGDEVGVYNAVQNSIWYPPERTTRFSGDLVETDGQLYLQNGNVMTPLNDAILQSKGSSGILHHNKYLSEGNNRYIPLGEKGIHPGLKDWEDIDKVDLGVDVFGIAGDIALAFPPAGPVVWVASEVAEIGTVGKAWDDLDAGSPSGVLIDTGATVLESAKLVPGAGFFGNLVSIGNNVLEITP